MIKAYQLDVKVKYIAEKLGVSRMTVYNYLKREGVKPNRKSK